jgi:hypothetical protein
MDAFWRLSTTRSFGFGIGPIPWHHTVEYGRRAGLENDTIDLFLAVIAAMDREFTQWHDDEASKTRKQSESKVGAQGSGQK